MLPFWNVNAAQPRQCGRRWWWGGFAAQGLKSGEPFGFAGRFLGCHSLHIPWWEYKALHSVRVKKPGRDVEYGWIMEQLSYSSDIVLSADGLHSSPGWSGYLNPPNFPVILISLLLLLNQLCKCIPLASCLFLCNLTIYTATTSRPFYIIYMDAYLISFSGKE